MTTEQNPTNLSEQLRTAIEASGLSLNEIARQTKVGSDQLSRFMRRERGLTLASADAICRVLKLAFCRTEQH